MSIGPRRFEINKKIKFENFGVTRFMHWTGEKLLRNTVVAKTSMNVSIIITGIPIFPISISFIICVIFVLP